MNACTAACGYCGRCDDDEDRDSDRLKSTWRTCAECGDGFLYRFAMRSYTTRAVCPDCQMAHSTQAVTVAIADYRQTRKQLQEK